MTTVWIAFDFDAMAYRCIIGVFATQQAFEDWLTNKRQDGWIVTQPYQNSVTDYELSRTDVGMPMTRHIAICSYPVIGE